MTKKEKMIKIIRDIDIGIAITFCTHIKNYNLSLRQIIKRAIDLKEDFKKAKMEAIAKKFHKLINKLVNIYFE